MQTFNSNNVKHLHIKFKIQLYKNRPALISLQIM